MKKRKRKPHMKRCQKCFVDKPVYTFRIKRDGVERELSRCRKCRGGKDGLSQKQIIHMARRHKIVSPAEKMAMASGRLAGRATLNQRNFLQAHGYDRDKVAGWTAHRASVEIGKIIQAEADAMCEALEADNHRQKKELDDGWDDAIIHK